MQLIAKGDVASDANNCSLNIALYALTNYCKHGFYKYFHTKF